MTFKVMTVVGTRPELIKLCRVINELDMHTKHILVHTGQNYDYELNEIFFKQLDIRKPDYFLDVPDDSVAQTIGNIIAWTDEVIEKEKPDAILILGDTNSSLCAITAKRRKIPIFHMEAGNRCFDARVPEEINRKIVDHLSDINLPYTEHARRYLISEGLRPETVIKTGSPMKEILEHYQPQIQSSDILKQLKLKPKGYFVVSMHREENIDNKVNFTNLFTTMNTIAKRYHQKIIVTTHPRTRKKLEKKSRDFDPSIEFLKPLGFFDYIKMQMNATCVISDSGTITEESSILNFPAVTIRQVHERPEGMDEGTLIMCGLKADLVIKSIDIVTAHYGKNQRPFKLVEDYNTGNVSKKILRIILSYTDYVNRVVWHKNN